MSDEKVLENRLRRKLDRMGYRLMRSRARDPDDITFGGYQIVDIRINGLVAGFGNVNRGYSMSLDDVQAWLTDETESAGDTAGSIVPAFGLRSRTR